MADNITVSDANDVDRVLRTTDAASIHTPHHIVQSSALPTGAATETTLGVLSGKVTACDTGAVTVAASALPALAATSTLQTTGNTHLSTIAGDTTSLDSKVTACNTGAVVLAAGTAEIGKLAAGTASIGTVILGAGTAEIGKLAAGTANIGDVDVATVAMPTVVYHGKKVVTAGTDEVIAGSQALTSGVNVKALAGNAGIVYVGVETVSSSTGYELSAKESVFIECDNTNRIWIDAATGSADGITYIAS